MSRGLRNTSGTDRNTSRGCRYGSRAVSPNAIAGVGTEEGRREELAEAVRFERWGGDASGEDVERARFESDAMGRNLGWRGTRENGGGTGVFSILAREAGACCCARPLSAFFMSPAVIRTEAFARAGLVGNPSEGYFGKTISFIIRNYSARIELTESRKIEIVPNERDHSSFGSLQELVSDVALYGYYGGIRLLKATVKRFF